MGNVAVEPPGTAHTRNANINIRVAPAQRDLIDRAAQAVGKTRTDFILDIAVREPTRTLLDQRRLFLDNEQWQVFTAALDAPLQPNEQLRRLLAQTPPWD